MPKKEIVAYAVANYRYEGTKLYVRATDCAGMSGCQADLVKENDKTSIRSLREAAATVEEITLTTLTTLTRAPDFRLLRSDRCLHT